MAEKSVAVQGPETNDPSARCALVGRRTEAWPEGIPCPFSKRQHERGSARHAFVPSEERAVTDPETCEACDHPLVIRSTPTAEQNSHDITSDGKLWCWFCAGECHLIADLRKRLDEAEGIIHAVRKENDRVRSVLMASLKELAQAHQLLESHGPEGHNFTNLQVIDLREQLEEARAVIEKMLQNPHKRGGSLYDDEGRRVLEGTKR